MFKGCAIGASYRNTYASAHNCRLNSACCALRCALVTLDDTFFSGGGAGSFASFYSQILAHFVRK